MPCTRTYSAEDLPATVDLICLRGDTLRSPVFTHKDPDGVLINLTGYAISCQGELSDGTAIDLDDYLVRNDAGGNYKLVIPPAAMTDSSEWPEGFGSYDITLIDTLGVKTTYFSGILGLREGEHE